MATTFLTNWQSLSPSVSNSWVDLDVSSHVSASATGIILKMINTSGSSKNFGFRNNGSTDARNQQMANGQWVSFSVGIDGSGLCEMLLQWGWSGSCYLVGYYEGEATFNVDADDLSIGTTGAWTDVDISSETGGETALAALLEARWNGFGTTADFGLRMNGSTDDRYVDNVQLHNGAIVGVDGSEIFEHYIGNTNVDIFLLGWMTDNVTMHTDATDRSTSTTGSYQAITSPDADADGAIYECIGGTSGDLGLRGLSQTTDLTDAFAHNFSIEKCDTGQCEQYITNTAVDIFETGWIGTASGGTTVEAITDTLVITENNASIKADTSLSATTESLALTAYNASVNAETSVAATSDTLVLTEHNATVFVDREISATTSTLVLTEYPASIATGAAVNATTVGLTLTEHNASVNASTNVEASIDALLLTEYAASVSTGVIVSAGSDSLVLTPYPVSIVANVEVQATADALVITTYQATIVNAVPAYLIDGVSNKVISSDYGSIKMYGNGENWFTL